MKGNEKERMKNPKVKTILTSKLIDDGLESLDDNCKSEGLVVHIEVDYKVQNEKYVVPTSKVNILVVLVNLTY